MDPVHIPNLRILDEFLRKDNDVDYCAISSTNDFANYEGVLALKYKIVNPSKQLTKVSKFIQSYRNQLHYDWYIKTRLNIQFLEPIDFSKLLPGHINARAREYRGPRSIPYGLSVGGEGAWKHEKGCWYNETETTVIMDDQVYIFDTKIIQKGVFDEYVREDLQNEWYHTEVWKQMGAQFHVIGLNVVFMCASLSPHSGHINC